MPSLAKWKSSLNIKNTTRCWGRPKSMVYFPIIQMAVPLTSCPGLCPPETISTTEKQALQVYFKEATPLEIHPDSFWRTMTLTKSPCIKGDKCEIHMSKISIISAKWVFMDYDKVTAIIAWPGSTRVKELQIFLHFANF